VLDVGGLGEQAWVVKSSTVDVKTCAVVVVRDRTAVAGSVSAHAVLQLDREPRPTSPDYWRPVPVIRTYRTPMRPNHVPGTQRFDPLHRFGLADQGCQAAIEAAIVRTIRNRAWPAIIFA
jgi:hypothetical protein